MSNIENALIKAKLQENKHIINHDSNNSALALSDIGQMLEGELKDSEFLTEHKIIHQEMKNKALFNEFRALRTLIMQKIQSENVNILVYSVLSGGGSSYVSANLAAAIALDSKKSALLINTDFKNQALYEDLIIDKTGLVDYLTGDISIENIIHPSGIKRMRIIPSGETESSFSEHFTSNKLKELFAEIKTRYNDRSIIVDSPSASEIADIKLLMEVIDYALLVVPYGKCNEKSVRQAADIIDKDKLLGIIINNKQQIIQ